MKFFSKSQLCLLSLAPALLHSAKAQDSHFKITISGGALDGKTLTGKVTQIPSRVGIGTHQQKCQLTFNQISLDNSTATANFTARWLGEATDGKKTPSFDKDGTPKYGNCGSLVIFDTSPDAPFSKAQIDFKDLDITINNATPWKLKSTKVYEGKSFSAKGSVKKSITKIYRKNPMKADSKTEDVTLTFSFTASVSRLK